ncbi:MAG: helix-turn-helix transcriptional regulator [Ruminococcus sp.]|nr:helix-turn-helix transcriptional regulator [Ruminococcus sp.]
MYDVQLYIRMVVSIMDWEEKFAERLTQLRMKKGVSARDMSLSIGQSPGYINNLENKNNLPSMRSFFYICEYLNVTPNEFFDSETDDPEKLKEIIADLKALTPERLTNISAIIKYLK